MVAYAEFYKTHHGLHVLDDKYVEGCVPCGERARISILARLKGLEPEEALSDATIARNLIDAQTSATK